MTSRKAELVYDDELIGEAKQDAAPVASFSYEPRKKWRPGACKGFIINSSAPVVRLKWPKKREAKLFFARLRGAA